MKIINSIKLLLSNTPNKYLEYILNEKDIQNYTFADKYVNHDNKLLKLFGTARTLDKHIRILIITDTHNILKEDELKSLIELHPNYDICLLLGDHGSEDIDKILKYVDKNKIYALLGNHDYNYIKEYNFNNLNGNIININNIKILGMEGSFKYKDSNFPSFSQIDSIKFLMDREPVDILVTHDRAFNNVSKKNPSHQGLFGITYYLYKNKVPYHIHGHIHNPYHKTLLNGTKEISSYMFEYIEL